MDIDDALQRLRLAAKARGLVSLGRFNYGGDIAADLRTVLNRLDQPDPDREDLIARLARRLDHLEALLEVRVARLGPDDIVVIQTPHRLPQAILDRLRLELERIAPGRKVVILTEGIELSIVAPTQEDRHGKADESTDRP